MLGVEGKDSRSGSVKKHQNLTDRPESIRCHPSSSSTVSTATQGFIDSLNTKASSFVADTYRYSCRSSHLALAGSGLCHSFINSHIRANPHICAHPILISPSWVLKTILVITRPRSQCHEHAKSYLQASLVNLHKSPSQSAPPQAQAQIRPLSRRHLL